MKRSNSDPFGYFSKEVEELNIIYKKPNKISALTIVNNRIFYFERQKMKFTSSYQN